MPATPSSGSALKSAEGLVERITEPEGRLRRMLEGVGTFTSDIACANELAKSSLEKSTAIQHILKGAGVATAGVTGEVLSEVIWQMVEGAIGKKSGDKAQELLGKITGSPVLKEIVENVGIMGAYNWASGQMGGALPKIPVHYLGLSVGIDVLDKGLLNKKGEKSTWLDYSNAVTDTGIGMTLSGIGTLAKEYRAVSRARIQKGKAGIEELFADRAKVQKTEKYMRVMEKATKAYIGENNGKDEGSKK